MAGRARASWHCPALGLPREEPSSAHTAGARTAPTATTAPEATRHHGVMSPAPGTESCSPPRHAVSSPQHHKAGCPHGTGTCRPREGCATACARPGQPQGEAVAHRARLLAQDGFSVQIQTWVISTGRVLCPAPAPLSPSERWRAAVGLHMLQLVRRLRPRHPCGSACPTPNAHPCPPQSFHMCPRSPHRAVAGTSPAGPKLLAGAPHTLGLRPRRRYPPLPGLAWPRRCRTPQPHCP